MSKELEYKELIEASIHKNPHSKENEDCFGEFYSEAFSRLQKSMSVLGDQLPPVKYIDKVVNATILQILKEKNRLTRRRQEQKVLPISNLVSYNINEYGEIVFNIPYPTSPREKGSIVIEQIKDLIKNLDKMNENEPEKHFTKLFELKYEKKLRIPEIAIELNISEESATQRLCELQTKLYGYY